MTKRKERVDEDGSGKEYLKIVEAGRWPHAHGSLFRK